MNIGASPFRWVTRVARGRSLLFVLVCINYMHIYFPGLGGGGVKMALSQRNFDKEDLFEWLIMMIVSSSEGLPQRATVHTPVSVI